MADVVFLKVDVDECEEVATDYNISCMPTFILLKNSEKVDEFSGANADKLKELIEQNKWSKSNWRDKKKLALAQYFQ